jgi:hypothetical protein
MVFLVVASLACDARYEMKTDAAFVSASSASFWMLVLGGRVPRARREVKVRGRRRSCAGDRIR